MQLAQAGDRFDPLASSAANGRAVGEKKRNVASQFRGQSREFVSGPIEPPADIRRHERGRGVARTAA
jgi:hypothetical protein